MSAERRHERVYALLLRAYPPAFRRAYGREMALLFRDMRRAARPGALGAARLWGRAVWDVARSAPALRLEAWRRGGDRGFTHFDGGTMRGNRAVAGLAVLGGAFQLVNTGAEIRAGYAGPGYGWALAMAFALLMGALLFAAGVLLLRPGGVRAARAAAAACLALVVGLQLVFPFMSIFARLLGAGIPLALLLVTRRPGGTPDGEPRLA